MTVPAWGWPTVRRSGSPRTTGSTDAPVGMTAAIRPGVVSLPHAWGAPGVNRLTSATADVEPLTGMPRFSGVPVEVTAV